MTDDSKPGDAVDDGKGRVFPCEGCGADLEFHIGQQNLACPYCGFEKPLEFGEEDASVDEHGFKAMLARMREHHEQDRHDESGQSELRCDSCGGTVVFQGSLTSSECPYCASPIQLDDVHDAEHRVPMDGVLPFLIERDRAKQNLAAWVRSRWFAPNEFKKRGVNGRFNGVYEPYWTYDAMTFSRYRGERGEHYWDTVKRGDQERRVRKTRWWSASGSFDRFFDDILILASRGLPRNLVRKLEPWPLEKCVSFTQEALAGFYARTYEVELEEGFQLAREIMDDAIRAEAKRRIGGDEQRVHSVSTSVSAVTFKHLLLPVWLLAYRYNDRTYQVMVNAATGEVQGERPWSIVKIMLAVLTAAAIVGGIALLQR
jgi:DNA-directed RNA polymerase subunit RPC12/RpoP